MNRTLRRLNPGALLWLAIIPFLVSCVDPGGAKHSSTHPQPEVLWVGTPAYARKMAEFKITLQEAETRVAAYDQGQRQNADPRVRLTGQHKVIIGTSYHFFLKQKDGRVPLSGFYVDGQTGVVEFRKVEGWASTRVPRSARP